MDYKFWLPFVATVVSAIAGLLQVRLQMRYLKETGAKGVPLSPKWYKKYWPVFGMVLAIILSWVPYFVVANVTLPDPIVHWGGAPQFGPNTVEIIVNGSKLLSKKSRYKVAAVCFHYVSRGDYVDSANLQKSRLFEIRDELETIPIPVDSAFVYEWQTQNISPTSYFGLLVPNDVSMDQFSTLRQAFALGVLSLGGKAGPP
jgi:hypothetical protein